jgi:hypothetical protein
MEPKKLIEAAAREAQRMKQPLPKVAMEALAQQAISSAVLKLHDSGQDVTTAALVLDLKAQADAAPDKHWGEVFALAARRLGG